MRKTNACARARSTFEAVGVFYREEEVDLAPVASGCTLPGVALIELTTHRCVV